MYRAVELHTPRDSGGWSERDHPRREGDTFAPKGIPSGDLFGDGNDREGLVGRLRAKLYESTS
jgi:hypothetical protein